MAELRKNPLTNDWIMIASHRQDRPQMPKDYCPFCPDSGKVPSDYDVYKYDNDFPALSTAPPQPDNVSTDFFETAPSYGKCEVVLYSPKHTITMPELPTAHIRKLVDLWAERFDALREDEKIKYVFIFENRGELVGVTMPHPHGQIYAYPFVPKKLELEIDNARQYLSDNKKCMFCEMLGQETAFKKRVIFKNRHFTVFLPFFSEYPYGVYIMSNSHKSNITEFNDDERTELAETLRTTSGMLDSLFDMKFPYMMCMYNEPVNGEEASEYFHFHIAFYPPMRSANKIKFNASSETGAWAHCNPTCPEDTAAELRMAYNNFLNK
ncbi:MAG: galactose-1-phosphate uridylyltransferase [Oscillospiraceae bacterium]|nr:galactose-1-phosphate uridylyltransferase [Oscillospiraceae bacterium]MDD3833397.1 galactose-1-phosphate uridylyltransferase [Oscillospiraceae bacterium]